MVPRSAQGNDESRSAQYRRQIEESSSDGLDLISDIADNPICNVAFEPAVPCIHVTWKRYATSAQLRYIHEMVLDLAVRTGSSKLLGDDTNLPTIHGDDQQWIVHDWMPRAVRAGLRLVAQTRSASHFGRVSVDDVRKLAPSDLIICAFDKVDDARTWLANAALPTAWAPASSTGGGSAER